jgi:hypothetical protein
MSVPAYHFLCTYTIVSLSNNIYIYIYIYIYKPSHQTIINAVYKGKRLLRYKHKLEYCST